MEWESWPSGVLPLEKDWKWQQNTWKSANNLENSIFIFFRGGKWHGRLNLMVTNEKRRGGGGGRAGKQQMLSSWIELWWSMFFCLLIWPPSWKGSAKQGGGEMGYFYAWTIVNNGGWLSETRNQGKPYEAEANTRRWYFVLYLMEEGSKLLRLAMFPVAKKEKKTRKKKRRTALTSSISSPGFDSPPCPVSRYKMTLVIIVGTVTDDCREKEYLSWAFSKSDCFFLTEIIIWKTQLASRKYKMARKPLYESRLQWKDCTHRVISLYTVVHTQPPH